MDIILFKKEYFWLSNMCKFDTPYKTKHGELPTGEHMYQYAKSKDTSWRKKVCGISNPYEVRKLSRDPDVCVLREDWEEIKDDVMFEVIAYKFSNHNDSLLEKLLSTDGFGIVHGNYHNDLYWGYCLKTNNGEDRLGKLIMDRRNHYLK